VKWLSRMGSWARRVDRLGACEVDQLMRAPSRAGFDGSDVLPWLDRLTG
jgi:hypothetical protein